MFFKALTKCLNVPLKSLSSSLRGRHSVLGIKELTSPEKAGRPEFTLKQVHVAEQDMAVEMIKKYYLPEHVLVRDRGIDLSNDCAIDEYLMLILKQGNTIYATSEDGKFAGICVGHASSPVDAKNLRTYAFYRQDPNTKDYLYFTAKLQETPNLWDTFKQKKIFEIKMLTVVPEFRRMGLATSMVEAAKLEAHDQGFHVIRMDCMNPFDYKVAERCMLHRIMKYPLHRLRGAHAPFVKRSSPNNCNVSVYVATRPQADTPDIKSVRDRQKEMECLIE